MKTNKLFILTGLAAIASTSCSQKENTSGQPAKPMNILYIMTDDHSFQTISAYDKRYIQTPNIDRIANEGVRFTNSFVANSISGPSRACMLTGKHSHKNGFIIGCSSRSNYNKHGRLLLLFPGTKLGISKKGIISFNAFSTKTNPPSFHSNGSVQSTEFPMNPANIHANI